MRTGLVRPCSSIPALLSETPALVSIALGVIANYVTDLFKGVPGKHTARLHVVVEQKDGGCVQLTYNGPATEIGEILDAVGDLTGCGRRRGSSPIGC